MPTINKMFLGKLVAATALFAALLVGVHTVQAHRIPAALQRQAERAADAGKADAAVHYLRQYLEFRPDDTDALARLAEMTRDRPGRGPGEQLLLYDKILRADPARHAVRRDALDASLRMGRYTDAETHALALIAVFPSDAELRQRLALAQAAAQKPEEATRSYEAALTADPANVATYQLYAQFLFRDQKAPEEARAVVDRLVAAVPQDPEAYLTRARFDAGLGQGATVLADLGRALDLDPENAEALVLLAEFYQKSRKLNEAHDCLAAGVKLYPADLRLIRSLAWLDLNMGNIGAAVGVLEDGMARVSDSFELLVPLADLLVQLGETGRSEEIVAKLQARPTPAAKMQTKYLRARLHMRGLRWAEAADLLTALRLDAVSMPGLESQTNLLLAACQQRRGLLDEERETLKLLLNKDPNHLAGRVGLAQAYLNAGRAAEATAEYETAVKSPYASPAVHATLVRLKCLEYARVGGRASDWAQLERVADDLTKSGAAVSSDPTVLRAEIAEARGDLRQATAILRAEASHRPGDVRLWVALADRVAKLAGVSAALNILDEAQAAAGDGAEVRLARADLSARDPALPRSLERLAEAIETWPDAEQTRLLLGLVEVLDRLGDEPGVVRSYQKLVLRRPNDLTLWETLGERAWRNGNAAAAQDALAAVTRLDPAGKSAALLNAWRAVHTKDTAGVAAVEAALTRAFGESPERADACVVRGHLKRLQNDAAGAAPLFERAVKLDPGRFPPMQSYLADVAAYQGDDAVRAVLLRLASDPRWAGEPLRRTVRAAAKLAPSAAKKILAAAAPHVEREPGGLGWLGDSYALAGLPTPAAECYARAVTLPVANADDWLRLAVRSPDQAAATLAQAQAKLPAGLAASVLASYAESGVAPKGWQPTFATAEARRLFLRASLSVKLSRFQRAEPLALLEAALADATLPPADAAWAGRNLAMLLAARGSAADRARAVTLLTATGDAIGDTPDEKRATAAVLTALARHLDGDARRAVTARAVQALESLVKETRSARDAYLLAQVYRAAGSRKAAIDVLNSLMEADPKNLDYHLMALEELTDLGQMTPAIAFAQRLLALYPTDFRAVAAVARFECKANRPERALALAEAYVRTADATVGDLPAKSARAAELLDELVRLPGVRHTPAGRKMTDAAVERYEALISGRPDALVAAAGLLAQDQRHAEGFALIDKAGKSLAARTHAAAGMAVVRAGGASERQFATVAEWLAAARRDEPDAPGPLLNEAEFYALKLDYARAEAVYAEVLAKEPRNVVALNNLAWILAPQPESSAKALELIDRAVAEVGVTGELLDTRARVRIASKQFELAEKDLTEALTQEKTGLRMFHLALSKQAQTPPRRADAATAFKQAKERGLEAKGVHPADLPQFRVLDAESLRGPS